MTSNAPFRFEGDVIKDTMSDVQLAKEVDESHDVGQPTAECQLIRPSRRRPATWRCVPVRAGWSRKHREECLCVDGVAFQRRLVTWREYHR